MKELFTMHSFTPAPVAFCDGSGAIVFSNSEFNKLFTHAPKNGDLIFKILPDSKTLKIDNIISENSLISFNSQIKDKKLKFNIQGISQFNLIQFFGIDISEAVSLKEQNFVLNSAMELISNAVMVTDRFGKLVFVNKAYEKSSGFSQKELMEGQHESFRPSFLSGETYKKLWKTIGSGKVWKGEFRSRRKNGEIFFESASIAPVVNGKGEISNYIAIKEEVTNIKTRHEELNLLRLFVNFHPGAMFRINDKGIILDANPAGLDYLGGFIPENAVVADFFPGMQEYDIRKLVRKTDSYFWKEVKQDLNYHFVLKKVSEYKEFVIFMVASHI